MLLAIKEGEGREITRNRSGVWWCPWDDHSNQDNLPACGGCGAEVQDTVVQVPTEVSEVSIPSTIYEIIADTGELGGVDVYTSQCQHCGQLCLTTDDHAAHTRDAHADCVGCECNRRGEWDSAGTHEPEASLPDLQAGDSVTLDELAERAALVVGPNGTEVQFPVSPVEAWVLGELGEVPDGYTVVGDRLIPTADAMELPVDPSCQCKHTSDQHPTGPCMYRRHCGCKGFHAAEA